MARIRLARIAFTNLQKAIFGTRRVALGSKKITYESPVLSLPSLLHGSECWVVPAENMRLLQRFHRKASTGSAFASCAGPLATTLESIASRPSCHCTRGEAGYPRHPEGIRALGYLGHVLRMDADRTPPLLQRCWVVEGKQPL